MANGRRVEFEAAFGVGGGWSRLLSRADGYLRTETRCESPESAQYRVRDFWSWHRNFEVFRERLQAEIESFEIWLRSESVIEKEQFLGAYYERFDSGSEQDLVLS
jgi:hypothetical protein